MVTPDLFVTANVVLVSVFDPSVNIISQLSNGFKASLKNCLYSNVLVQFLGYLCRSFIIESLGSKMVGALEFELMWASMLNVALGLGTGSETM